jgi:O-antigen/teichoic acid export membrane protein
MNKYIKATSFNFLFFAIGSIAFLILTPLAIKVMGSDFFGLWSILFAITQFANIGTLGISSIVNKFSSEINCDNEETSSIISSALIVILPMAFVTTLIIIGLRDFLISNIKPSPIYAEQFNDALILCAFCILPQFIYKIFQGYFLSRLENQLVRGMELISAIFPLVGGILLSAIVKNLLWLSIWNLIVQISILCIYIFVTRRRILWNWSPKTSTLQRMLRFSAFLILESSASNLFQQFDRVLVGMTLGSVATGVYSVATGVGSRLAIISGQATETMMPYSSLKHSMGQNDQLYTVFRKLSKYLSFMVASLATLCIIWMREILSIWISPEYATANYMVFTILIMAYAFLSLSRPAYQTLTGLGLVQFTSLIYLFASVIMIGSLYFLSREYGLLGAAYSNFIMMGLLSMNLCIYKILNKKLDWRHVSGDLKWGIILPVISYLIILFQSQWYIKVCFSLLLLLFDFLMIRKDSFIRDQFRNIQKMVFNKRKAIH